jgi:hypothetical protein
MIRGFLLAAVVASPVASPLPVVPIGGAFVRSASALDAAAWARLPHVKTKAVDHDGKVGEYDGVRLADLLKDAGAPVGDAVRGKAARAYVLVSASDGYTAIFTLAELDSVATRCAPLLADARDQLPLSSDTGPVRVVAPCDRTHARWVRGVTKLTVVVASETR